MTKPKRKAPAKRPVSNRQYTAKHLLKMLPEEHSSFSEAARCQGTNLSAWLRNLGRRACGLPVAGVAPIDGDER